MRRLYVILKRVETQQMLETRNSRFQKWFASALRPSSARPDIDIGGNYCSTFGTRLCSGRRNGGRLGSTQFRNHSSRSVPTRARRSGCCKCDRRTEEETNEVQSVVRRSAVRIRSRPDVQFRVRGCRVSPQQSRCLFVGSLGLPHDFHGAAGVIVVWWASSYDGVDLEIPWSYVVVFAIGVVACIFMALQ